MTHSQSYNLMRLALGVTWWLSLALSCRAAEAEATPNPADKLAAPVLEDTGVPHTPDVTPTPLPNENNSAATAPVSPSQNVTINLINRLVQRGVLTKEDAAELIHQAEQDAATARNQAAAAAQATPTPPPADNEVRVTYVPDTVKAQIRDEVKQEVMDEARTEHWAAPDAVPDWVSRYRFFGDVRVRYEGDFYPSGNDNTGAFPNFNAINTGPPFDVSGSVFSPQYNVDQDRTRFRIRIRGGAEMNLGSGFTAGIRLATGEDNSPTTTNQTLGVANQKQGGDFSKYNIWLDRGFLAYEIGGEPTRDLKVSVGRFDNPFFATTMIWDDDIGFDGIGVQARYGVTKGVTAFFAGGAFPVFNTDLNFSTNRPDKFSSEDKYLYAGQLGGAWQVNKDFAAKIAVAYYYFDNVQGRLSDPFTPLTSSDEGDTDDSRPSFAQRGNTYFPIRDIVPTAANDFGTIDQFQYFGLASAFHELAVTGRLDFGHFDPVHIALVGEYVTNLAFDNNYINSVAVNNRGPNTPSGALGSFQGGNNAGIIQISAGAPALQKRWDWNFTLGYRYVESDAVVDGFVDSDFGGGGTNLQGYTISAQLALTPNVWMSLQWLSADSIAGPTYKSDIIQFDINGKF